jgi:hypothetical protein
MLRQLLLGRVSLICLASFTWATNQHICFHNTLPSLVFLWGIWQAGVKIADFGLLIQEQTSMFAVDT